MSYCFNPYCSKPQNCHQKKRCLTCQTPLLLQNRYSALKIIGQGGMGRTFLVINRQEQSTASYYVIKQFFPQSLAANNRQKATELFIAEAAILERLGQHSQIPRLHSYFAENEYQYLVQEWIQGENLVQVINNESIFQENDVIQILHNLLTTLLFVHDHQIIHRDIKPENIIRRSDGTLTLVDFGAAKAFKEQSLSKTGTIIGSPEYIAPEQLRGKALFSSDLYSLGVTCLYLLTGVSPFDLYSDSQDTWVWRDYLVNTSISTELGQIIDKMIARATVRRYQSAKEVLQDLDSKTGICSQEKVIPDSANKERELVLVFESEIDYTQLQELLKAQKWQEANQLTEQLLLQAVHQPRKSWLERDDLENLSCEDLNIIDRLWSNHSDRQFGFSVQYSIWQNLERKNYRYFGDKVGWYVAQKWLRLTEINFSIDAPQGHLPVISWWFGHAIWGLKGLFSKIDSCDINKAKF